VGREGSSWEELDAQVRRRELSTSLSPPPGLPGSCAIEISLAMMLCNDPTVSEAAEAFPAGTRPVSHSGGA
jgi:hypothetical protein